MTFKKYFFTTTFLFLSYFIAAQIPNGYYDNAEGKEGYTLKTELFFIIDGHANQGYNALWSFYEMADVRADGFVWDIYSACDLQFGTDQDPGSGGNTECDKFNREHTFPQSWFDAAAVPRADAHMVLPTDKKVNSERGNFPYGEVSNATYTSLNGSKKGNNTLAGYSGVVFEPADEFKGDLARIYFYMATRYQSQIDGWETSSTESNIVLNGTEDQVFENWVLEMLIDWHINDPVSQKEIDRNNAVFNFQGNRNPFVDHPEWVNCIWKNSCNETEEPVLTSNNSSLAFGTVQFEEETEILNFTLVGSSLNAPIEINSNAAEFSISKLAESGFSNSLTINPDQNGNVNQMIYVKFEAIENVSATLESNILITQAEVESLTVTVSGTIEARIPSLTFSEAPEIFGANLFYDNTIGSQSITLSGLNFDTPLNINVANDFKVSTDDVTFQNSLEITPDVDGNINSTLFINFLPDNLIAGNFTGTLEFSTAAEIIETLSLEAHILDQDTSIFLNASIDSISFGEFYFTNEAIILSFDLNGKNLSLPTLITAENNLFSFSTTDNGDYQNSLEILPDELNEINQTIYVKFQASENIDAEIASNILITQDEVADFKIAVSAMVREVVTPKVTIDDSLNIFETNIFYNSDIQAQLINFSAEGIPDQLEIKTSNGFKISNSGNNFSESIQYNSNSDRLINEELWVTYQAVNMEAGEFSANLDFINDQETLLSITLHAKITEEDTTIFLSFQQPEMEANIGQNSYEIIINSNRIVDYPVNFTVTISDFNQIFYPAQFLTEPEATGTSISLSIPKNDSLVSFLVKLDTAKLKTNLEKSFAMSIQNSTDFKLGEFSNMLFSVLPYEPVITANQAKTYEGLIIYPNPVQSHLSLSGVEKGKYFIYSVMGRLMMSGEINNQHSINTINLPAGFYQLMVRGKAGNFSTKFIKQ